MCTKQETWPRFLGVGRWGTVLVVSGLVANSALLAQGPAPEAKDSPAPNGSVIGFSETAYDFGELEQGKTVEHVFKFKNLGGQALHITDISVSCASCLRVRVPQVPLAPGETDSLRVTLTAGYRAEAFNHTIVVSSNDQDHPHVPLTVTGQVKKDITWSPEQLFFGNVYLPETKRLEVTMWRETGHPLAVEKIRNETVYFALQTKAMEKEALRIVVESRPNAPTGPAEDTLEIRFGGRDQTLKIPIKAFFIGPVDLKPDYAMFGFVRPGESKEARLTIACNLKGEFRMGAPKGPERYVEASVRKLSPPNMYELTARLTGLEKPGKWTGVISIPVTSPVETILNIPCFAYVDPSLPLSGRAETEEKKKPE